MTFRIGQKVRIVKSPYPMRVGLVTTVLSEPMAARFGEWTDAGQRFAREHGLADGTIVYEIDAEPADGASRAACPETWLAPIPDDTVSFDEELSSLLPRTIRDLCSAGTAERAKRAKRKAGV